MKTTISLGEDSFQGLGLLLGASHFADDSGRNIWEFAHEIGPLFESGITVNLLRWLMAKGYIEHGREISIYGDIQRRFERSEGFNFVNNSCFILTEEGRRFVTGLLGCAQDSQAGSLLNPNETETPVWNPHTRELCFCGALVKRFRVPARNQECLLDVFEEDGWPKLIEDPLPQTRKIDPKIRLHDTINRLNHRQVNPVLKFHGNGNGNGIYWEGVLCYQATRGSV